MAKLVCNVVTKIYTFRLYLSARPTETVAKVEAESEDAARLKLEQIDGGEWILEENNG